MKTTATLLVLLLGLGAVASPAAAQELDCAARVNDLAGVLDERRDEIRNAADDLVRAGADVHVVVVDTLGGTRAEDFVTGLLSDCPSWETPGERDPDLLVVLVGIADGVTRIDFGSSLAALDPQRTEIDVELMNPRFAEGDFAGGLLAGLTAMRRLLSAAAPAPDDDGSSATVWIILLTIAVVALAGLLGARLLTRVRARNEARGRVRSARAGASGAYLALQQAHDTLGADGGVLAASLGLAEATEVRDWITEATAIFDVLHQRWIGLTNRADPERPADASSYDEMAGDYAALATDAAEARAAIERSAEQVDEIREIANGLDARFAAIAERQAGAEQAIALARRDGYRTDPADADLDDSRQATDDARRAQAAGLVLEASRELTVAEQELEAAVAWATGIEEMRADLAEDQAALRSRHADLAVRLQASRHAFERIEATCAPSAWRDIAGNGTAAERELGDALQALALSQRAATPEVQEWDDAHDALVAAEEDLDDAEVLLDAISQTDAELEHARDHFPEALRTADSAIRDADAYLGAHDPDIDDRLNAEPERAAAILAQARVEARSPRPDYRAALAAVQQARDVAERVLAQAREAHRAAELRRARLTRARDDAQQAVTSYQRYVTGHRRWLIGRDEAGTLAALERDLQGVGDGGDPEAQIAAAQSVRRQAQSALASARTHVRSIRYRPPAVGHPRGGGVGTPSRRGGLADILFGGGGFGGGGRSGGGSRARSGGGSRIRSSSFRGSSSRSRSSSGRGGGRTSRW